MYVSQHKLPKEHVLRAGYYPDPERIVILNKMADGITELVEGFLSSVKKETSGGDRYMINIHTDIETLKQDGTGAESDIEDRGHVPAETSRRLACDCSVVHWNDNK